MSISEENNSYADTASFIDENDDNETVPSHYENVRGDRYSEETSSYHASVRADPLSKNKKHVKRVNPDTGKLVRVEFFPTQMVPNAPIKNAITGTYQVTGHVPGQIARFFRVGSADEDLFFSVILATGETGQDPATLFYDNPEQYERHFYTKLSKEMKDYWLEKRDAALYRLKLQQQRASKVANGGVITVK